MPNLPQQTQAPYDSIEMVLNMARMVLADYIPGSGTIQGDILSDTQPYTVPILNIAWRKLQRRLAKAGHPRLTRETDILGLPAVTTTDPAIFTSLDWTGYFDGTSPQASVTVPQDYILPLKLMERQNGTLSNFKPMEMAKDGLPSRAKGSSLSLWDWREDKLWFIGSVIKTDLRVRYAAYLGDLAAGTQGLGATPVPIMRAAEALSYYTAEAFIEPRGGTAAATFAAKGDNAADDMNDATAKVRQRSSIRRRPFGARAAWR